MLIITSSSLLSSCVPLLVGSGVAAGASVASDRRALGTYTDDKTIEWRARTTFKTAQEYTNSRIAVTSYNHNLLLVGQIPDKQTGDNAAQYASTIPGVERVINQLKIGPIITYQQQLDDTAITSRVKFALSKINITGFDITRVKVITENRVVYLMGMVTHEEADRIVGVTQQVEGISQIVKVFDFTD